MSHRLPLTFRAIIWTVALLFLLELTFMKVPMVMARIHVKHLLTDFQSIRPMESKWADAERLMRRWGPWGSYKGTCTPADCTYSIIVQDSIAEHYVQLSENMMGFLANHGVGSMLGFLGWHSVLYYVEFTVQDGIIVRTHSRLNVEVFPHLVSSDWNEGYTLMLGTQVRSRLNQPPGLRDQRRILGGEGTPSAHPDYKVGRPDGCTNCLAGELTYTPQLSQSEILRLTSYNLSCLTRWHSCTSLEDLLPAASEWHLYDWLDAKYQGPPKPVPHPCIAPARALARDASIVFEADVLSVDDLPATSETKAPSVQEVAHLHLRTVLKRPTPINFGDEILVSPFTYLEGGQDYTSEHFIAGSRVIVLFLHPKEDGFPWFQGNACGILLDTSDTLKKVKLGIAQDVSVRRDSYIN